MKFGLKAPTACLTAGLLAVILQTGTNGRTSLDIARDMLSRYGCLASLLAADRTTLTENPGIGHAKAARFVAMKELLHWHMLEGLYNRRISLLAPKQLEIICAQNSETARYLAVYLLYNQHYVVELEEFFCDTIDSATVYPREVVKRSLYHIAAAVILAYNHPYDIAGPSQVDVDITNKLRIALETIDVRVLNHFVIGKSLVVLFAERGLL